MLLETIRTNLRLWRGKVSSEMSFLMAFRVQNLSVQLARRAHGELVQNLSGSTRHGELMASLWRAGPEATASTRSQLAFYSLWRAALGVNFCIFVPNFIFNFLNLYLGFLIIIEHETCFFG
ncbi:hypothetical protein QL285_087733 [Trifolium repens]|nr:hypothetical protein QL285_087733 [Trifolium repens]